MAATRKAAKRKPKEKSLWEQLRDARNNDYHEEKPETEELRWRRNEEREAELPHPQCCDQAKKYVFAHRVIDPSKDEVLNDGVPVWKLTFNKTWEGEYGRESLPVHFCPFCGQKLPALVKKAQPPKHIVKDGGYRCKGCGERFGRGYCWCSYPESAFEIAT